MKPSLQVMTGDILAVTTGVIAHQVNTRRIAGAGLARALRERYPDWYIAYRAADPALGRMMLHWVSKDLAIASLYAQSNIGTQQRQTNYAALGAALLALGKRSRGGKSPQVYVPYRMGCGLAGGDWAIVLPIIADALPHAIIVQRPQDA